MKDHKKLQVCKPGSVLCYHLSAMNIAVHLYLPTLDLVCPKAAHERAVLNRSYTWHFSTQGLPSWSVTTAGRGLLPHIFTLSL